jgi:hypothetical protein
MKNFEFKSQICTDRLQSEKLLALGLKKETADCGMYWSKMGGRWIYFIQNKAGILCSLSEDEIPAWSLHRLMLIANANTTAFLDIEYMYETLIKKITSNIKQGFINKDYMEEK